MCPACMSSAAVAIAGATSTGIFGAIVLKALSPFKRFRKPPLPIIGKVEERLWRRSNNS